MLINPQHVLALQDHLQGKYFIKESFANFTYKTKGFKTYESQISYKILIILL